MKSLVSIIVPVYNVENYIEKCISSICEQNYASIEIIIVDDGSPDNSPAIIDRLSKDDSRITVIHKQNGGVSSARNAGLKIAKGEYVTFVDGDDWIDKDYISYFMTLIQRFDCDVAMNRYNYSQTSKKSRQISYVISDMQAIEWIYIEKIFVAVWNKIYKVSFLRKNNLYFDESIWFGEGMLFNIDCLQFTDKVAIGEKCVYHQTPNPDSAMRKFNLTSCHCGIKSLELQKEHWKKENTKIDNAWNYHRYAFNWTIMGGMARSGTEDDYASEYKRCVYNLKHDLWMMLKVDIPLKKKLLYVCLALNPEYMALREKRKLI
jgi:glycosyltransferase involved in cell wall biosynthesis